MSDLAKENVYLFGSVYGRRWRVATDTTAAVRQAQRQLYSGCKVRCASDFWADAAGEFVKGMNIEFAGCKFLDSQGLLSSLADPRPKGACSP